MENKKGITLIGLMVTIIVMLILAGISIKVVVNENFFGKADNANKMNNEAINTAHKAEENAIKQDVVDFSVDKNWEVDEIEAYEFIENETIELKEGEVSVSYIRSRLKKIEYSLSKYLDEHNGNATVYFKANTNKQNLNYTVSGTEVSGTVYNEFYEDREDGIENIKISSNSLETGYVKTNTLIAVDFTSKSQLDGLTIEAKSGSYSQKIIFNNLANSEIIYLPTNTEIGISADFEDNKVMLKWTEETKNLGSIHTIIDEAGNAQKKATITEKTAITLSEVTMKNKNNFIVKQFDQSTISTNGNEKLYLVQEITDDNKKNIYMDDYNFEFYNPIYGIELSSPKVLQYVTPRNLEVEPPISGEKIQKTYIGKDIDIEPDVLTFTATIKKKKIGEIETTIPNFKSKYETYFGNLNKGFYITDNYEYIYSDLTNSEVSSLLEKLGKNTYIEDKIEITLSATDYGGNEVTSDETITVAVGNFLIWATNNSGNKEVKDTLTDALKLAGTMLSDNEKVVVQQMISNYSIEESLYTKEEGKNENNDEPEDKYYLDIGEVSDNTTLKYDFNGLIYDINGNTLNFKDEAKLRIAEGTEFTLRSSKDAYSYANHQNGSMIFNHETTFTGKVDIQTFSLEKFFSVEKYKYLKSIKTFIASLGEETTGLRYILNCIKYAPLYTTRLMNSYKEYINSYNNIGVQNKNYKHSMEAIINNGKFNFESGRIQVSTDETVTAFGAFGGGVVINVADSFLKVLREFGIETASLTDYAASFAKLENTAVGVKNHGTVILGTGSGVQSDANPFPEICVLVDSAANGIGLSVGNITNPNRVVSRAYGVWNAVSTASTTMNSGFMEMAITNNTNNWVSLNVGRTYGIFNDHGTTTLNGFTKKEIIREISIYGLITKNIIKQRDVEGDNKIKNALTEAINNVDKFWEDAIQSKTFDGFFSYSELQILYKLTGGGTTCYTNSYAIANAEGRNVYKDENNNKFDDSEGDKDGIIFGENFGLVEKEFEGTIEANIFNKSMSTDYKLKIPGYYVLYEEKGKTDEEKKQYNPGPNGNDIDHDYHDNTFQKISNPINHYFDFDTMFGTAFSSGTNAINNIINTSWIGEDFKDDNIIYNLIKQTIRGIGNSIKEILGN